MITNAEPLRAALQSIGLTIRPLGAIPPGRHPIYLDIWHVEGGHLEAGGVDQHGWAAAVGAAAGATAGYWRGALAGSGLGALRGAKAGARLGGILGPLGEWWGTAAGWWAGGALGAIEGAAIGVVREGEMGAAVGQAVSEGVSRAVATYDEVLVAVPNVVRANECGRPYMYVLGMLSNGAMSILGDRALGCGYHKRQAEISRHGIERDEVRVAGKGVVLTALMTPGPEDGWGAPDTRLAMHRGLFSQPLLGHLGAGRFAVTFLDRFLDDPAVRWAPASARLAIAADLIDGLPGGTFDVPALSPGSPFGAFQASGVLTKVTLTRHV